MHQIYRRTLLQTFAKSNDSKIEKKKLKSFFCESIMKRNIFLPFKYTNSFDCVLTNYWVCCSFILWLCDYREIILLEWKNFKVLTGVKVLIKYMKILRKSFCDTLGTAKILCSSNIGFLIIHLQNLKPIHLRAAQSINIFSMLMLLTLHLLWSSIFFFQNRAIKSFFVMVGRKQKI